MLANITFKNFRGFWSTFLIIERKNVVNRFAQLHVGEEKCDFFSFIIEQSSTFFSKYFFELKFTWFFRLQLIFVFLFKANTESTNVTTTGFLVGRSKKEEEEKNILNEF